jgi:AbiTii-like protein
VASKMKLLDEIVDLAVEGETSLPVLLRKCLVLSHRLKNERLKVWTQNELDGYTNDDALPDYRVTNTNSKGIFFGAFGSKIENQPIPTLVLKEHHRALVEIAHLRSPIASYQLGTKGDEGQWRIPWSPNLVALYQAKFYEGAYVLVSAWQELPTTFIAALLDTVRNRVLRLALELQEELGSVGDDPAALRPERIDQTVITNIFGGHVVIAGRVRDVTQAGSVVVIEGDLASLKEALAGLGTAKRDVRALEAALKEDRALKAELGADAVASTASPGIGQRTLGWIQSAAIKLASKGGDAALDVAKAK